MRELIIFIDEFDRFSDKEAIGEFIKQAGHIRFVFIGLTESIKKLVQGHQSTKRKITPLYINRLTKESIIKYFEIGKKDVSNDIEFDSEFVEKSILVLVTVIRRLCKNTAS